MSKCVPHPTGRQLLALVIGMVVCLCLASTLLPHAQALPPSGRSSAIESAEDREPLARGEVHATAVIKDKITFGRATLRAGKQAGKIARTAMSKSGKTLNYAKAKAAGGETKWRRQFAAGVYWRGGTVTHISDAELVEVKKFMPASPAVIVQQAPNCRGENKTVVVRHDDEQRITDIYYDSCKTIDFVTARDEASVVVCGIGAGAAGVVNLVKKIPRAKEAIAVFSALCYFYMRHDLRKVNDAVAKSTLGALIVRSDSTYYRGPKDSTYIAVVRYYPQ